MPEAEPGFSLGNLAVQLHGPQVSEEGACEQDDWLVATAACHSAASQVRVEQQPLVTLSGLGDFRAGLTSLIGGGTGEARLGSAEMGLEVIIKPYVMGQFEMAVRISPDTALEQHAYTFLLDKEDLQAGVNSLDAALHGIKDAAGRER
jgi:hypothetical protein